MVTGTFSSYILFYFFVYPETLLTRRKAFVSLCCLYLIKYTFMLTLWPLWYQLVVLFCAYGICKCPVFVLHFSTHFFSPTQSTFTQILTLVAVNTSQGATCLSGVLNIHTYADDACLNDKLTQSYHIWHCFFCDMQQIAEMPDILIGRKLGKKLPMVIFSCNSVK